MSEVLSDLTDAGVLDGTELIYVVKGGNSRRSTAAAVKAAPGAITATDLIVTGTTTLEGIVNITPADANVVIAPSGTGTATIAPVTAGTLNNMVIGGVTPLAGSFTNMSASGTLNVTGVSTLGAVNAAGITGTTGGFSGAVSGTTGTFSAGVSGTTGTFSGAVSGTTGTFSGAISGADISGTTGVFSGTVEAGSTFRGSSTTTILATVGAGTVFLRPNGSASTSGQLTVASTGVVTVNGNAVPASNDGAALGTTSLSWSDAFFATGGVLNWGNGNVTITHSSGDLSTNQSWVKNQTQVATTSGTSIDFTGIPSWVKRITIMLSGVSTNGTSALRIQLGDAGGVENTGYVAGIGIVTATPSITNITDGFGLNSASATSTRYGTITLQMMNAATFTWSCTGLLYDLGGTNIGTVAGGKSTSAALDRVRLTTTGGADTFDAGTMNIAWE